MHPALILDAVVSKAAQLMRDHPMLRSPIRCILRPFAVWRFKGIARTLAKEYKQLPVTSWVDVEKHGQNVVYCARTKKDIFSKKERAVGAWVVDYKNKTIRTVLDVPEKYHEAGSVF